MQRFWFVLFLALILISGLLYGWYTYRDYHQTTDLGIAERELNNCPALMDEAAIKSVKIYQQLQKAVSHGNLFIVQRNAKILADYLSKINPDASAAARKLAQADSKLLAQSEFKKFDQLLEPKNSKSQPNILILP